MNIRIKSYLILLVTFSLGIVAGALISRVMIRTTVQEILHANDNSPMKHGKGRGPSGPNMLNLMLERRIEAVVQPNDDQRKRLSPIIQNFHEKLQASMQRHLKMVEPLLDSLDSDLKTVLTASQLEKWKEHRKSQMSHRRFGPPDHRHPIEGGGPGFPLPPPPEMRSMP
jgi:hypothetical protein